MSSRSAPFSPSVRIFARGKALNNASRSFGSQVEIRYREKQKFNCRIVPAHTIASQLTNTQLESRAMAGILPSPKADLVSAGDSSRLFDWPRQITGAERKSLIAGGLGWMLDAMDVMLYSLVIAYLIREFSMDTRTAGFLNSLTLVASAIGGLLFGVVADRIGRTGSLMISLLVYSLASAACAFSHSVTQLAVFRFVLGLGMGGEWTAAAALIAETWRPEHRGKALGLMQAAYAIGEAIAALVVAVVLPHFGWRAVFFVGVLPALLVFWIQSSVPEPALWTARTGKHKRAPLKTLLSGEVLKTGALATTMKACGL